MLRKKLRCPLGMLKTSRSNVMYREIDECQLLVPLPTWLVLLFNIKQSKFALTCCKSSIPRFEWGFPWSTRPEKAEVYI